MFRLVTILISLLPVLCWGQLDPSKKYSVNTIAFYNVENLFDTIDDPKTFDDDRTPNGRDKWTEEIYLKKSKNIARWEDYIDFMKAQLTELLTNYGEIGGIWFDGQWDQHEWDGKRFGKIKVDFKLKEVYDLIHKLQPKALIGSNHHLAPNDGEDFQMFEDRKSVV